MGFRVVFLAADDNGKQKVVVDLLRNAVCKYVNLFSRNEYDF